LKEFLGDDLFLVEATEPTNIIWENRHFTEVDTFRRSLKAFAAIVCLLIASFLTIYYFKSIAINTSRMYPSIQPAEIVSLYQTPPSNTEDNTKMDLFYSHALQEFNYFDETRKRLENKTIDFAPSLSGFYQSFCQIYSKTPERFENVTSKDPSICDMYSSDQLTILTYNQSIKFLIIGINVILRMLIIKLIEYIGVDTESEQARLTTNGVFVVQFFNTALLLLVVNANLIEQGFPFSLMSSARGMSDFSHVWFSDIGITLTGAMLFNVYYPIVEFFMFGAMRKAFRWMDRGFSFSNFNKTKKSSIQLYVELYSGPVFFIHYKYSGILNIVFVTMMYGMGLPILFPIAALSLLVIYCMEKMMLYFVYREPPMYDEKLNNNALSILTYAPLLFLSFGYWMLSSK
jgi:hypothetical protein